MNKIIMTLIAIAGFVPMHGITITFNQVGDASQREHVVERTFYQKVRQGCFEHMVAASLTYRVNSDNKTLTLEVDSEDVIAVSTYVEQRPYVGEWTLHSVDQKFKVTQDMHNNVIELNRDTYTILEPNASSK